ncbi:LacI family DNA-binding transcriptional regulator [Leuconostoc pseudomesenteroides]|uniref:LacI family DNA-binding transcriptional regulator n=1 Tax=Leuconostoc pseudomesenteroides TaxID=33968 RepID=UPI0016689C26|nr:LacI family DNA-binding transcriptional regulator [Leuconostoc pseudomesenteroides]
MDKHKRATIKDVAKKSDVSTATISRYLNGKFNEMSKQTAKKIEIAIRELDYTRNSAAVQLVNRKSNLVAVIVDNIDEYFAAEYFKGIVSILSTHGLVGVLFDSNSDVNTEKKLLDSLESHHFAGLIFQPLLNQYDVIDKLRENNFPVVLIDRLIKSPMPISSVTTNNFQVTKETMDIFYSKGFRKVTVITERIGNMSTRIERIAGIKSVFENTNIIEHNFDHMEANNLCQVIDIDNPNNLVFALKEKILIQILSKLNWKNESNIQNITGFIDTVVPKYLAPHYKFIQQSPFYMGAAAAEIIIKDISNQQELSDSHVVIQSEFK